MEKGNGRTVAIVGRPNVGKSSLFNRLVGRRLAIVHEESGVTRDRLVVETSWGEERFYLIDTGGIGSVDGARSDDVIQEGIDSQVAVAIEDATAIIMVVDVEAGMVPMDEGVARQLHESGRPVFVAANKADTELRDGAAAEFNALNFPVYPVSALHGRGLDDLLDATLKALPEVDESEVVEPLKVAIVGRPNVGKSSYINRLLRSDRVIVSNIPGTTRDSIEIPFSVGTGPAARHYVLVDTAGVRRKGKVDTVVERFSAMRTEGAIKRADLVVLVLDASAGPREQDKKLASMIIKYNKGCVIFINKWDLAEEVTQRRYGAALREAVPFLDFAPVIFASALSGYNIRRTIDAIDYVSAQVQTEMTTGLLNRVMREAFDKVQPPMVDGKRLRLYYATQVGVKPVRIRLYVNSHRRVKENYRKYLLRILRESFGLEGAPVVLHFTSKKRDEA